MSTQSEPTDETSDYAAISPPIRFGLKRAYYQYSTSIPASHLVLVSVLEGIVFGVLLLNPLNLEAAPSVLTFAYMLKFFNAVAPFVATSMIILLTWTDFVYASTVLIWPPTILLTALIFITAVPQVIAAREINDFPVWVVGASLVTLTAGIIRFTNRLIFRSYDFDDERLGANLLSREIAYGAVYTTLAFIGFVLIIAYPSFRAQFVATGQFHDLSVDDFMHAIGYIMVLAIEVGLTIMVSRYQAYFMTRVTKGTDLEVTSFGGIRHRRRPV